MTSTKLHRGVLSTLMLLGLWSPYVVMALGVGTFTSTTASSASSSVAPSSDSSDMETCQCGVFLLGTKPLVFSSDAKPILSGMPVPANCSARSDKIQCASICRQLIETMSQSNEDAPLVQTVVLAATRTLACQRFNESDKVPLPRTIDASHSHHARLDDKTNQWQFLTRPFPRSDVSGESGSDEESDMSNQLTEPKFLGGFYRWCDQHWIYAGVSLHEPLCCLQHLPKKCPDNSVSTTRSQYSRNGRRPRLIIRRCKDDCSSEEDLTDDFANELSLESQSTPKPTPENTEDPLSSLEDPGSPELKEEEFGSTSDTYSMELETINPFDPSPPPLKNRKPLNSTAVAEAFKFLTSLMDSIGYGDIVAGITSVLPASTAAELIDRVDVGGWISNYQDRYMAWPREFSMGYCYLEYGLYNMAADGIVASTNQFLSRVFKTSPQQQRPSTAQQALAHNHLPPPGLPPPMPQHLQNPPPAALNYPTSPNQPAIPNFISPMAPPGPDSFASYSIAANRRVRRSPAVTVSRSYSVSTSSNSQRPRTRTPSYYRPRPVLSSRSRGSYSEASLPELTSTTTTTPSTTTTTPSTTTTTPPSIPLELLFSNSSGSKAQYVPLSSFIPTSSADDKSAAAANYPDPSAYPSSQSAVQQHPANPYYYQNQYYNYEVPQQRNSFQQQPIGNPYQPIPVQLERREESPNLSDFARPRRNPHPHRQQPAEHRMERPPPPPPKGKNGKEGQGGNLMNIAGMLMQTAMAANNPNGDPVAAIMQNAIPLVSQVASNPSIQNMVSGLVTSFLTPPQPKPNPPPGAITNSISKPKPKPTTTAAPELDDLYSDLYYSDELSKPAKDSFEDNEILEPEVSSSSVLSSSSSSGSNNRPPPTSSNNEGGMSMLQNMLYQMVTTYIGNIVSGKPSGSSATKPPRISEASISSKPKPEKESKDIVDLISDVAKPFFISYFGVVPDVPGFGQLRIARKKDNIVTGTSKEGFSANDILDKDPDPGTGLTDILFGAANIPETGNSVIDFGNRVVYAFHYANDPQHGMYCFKQYTVNKLWDYFRVGVKYVFKK